MSASEVTSLDALAAAALHGGRDGTEVTGPGNGLAFGHDSAGVASASAGAGLPPGASSRSLGKRRQDGAGDVEDDDDDFAFASAEKRLRRAKEEWEEFPSGDFDVTFNPPLKSAWKDSWSWRSLKSTKLTSGSRIARACQGLLECGQQCGFTERPFVHGNKLQSQKKASRCQSCGAEMVHLPCAAKSSIVKDAEGRTVAFEHQGVHPHPRPALKRGFVPGPAQQAIPAAWMPPADAREGQAAPSASAGDEIPHQPGTTSQDDGRTSVARPTRHLPPVLTLDKATLMKPFCIFCSRPWAAMAAGLDPLAEDDKLHHLLDSHRFDLARLIALDPQLELRFDAI